MKATLEKSNRGHKKMNENRPSTSAEGEDDEECYFGTSITCEPCETPDIQIHSTIRKMKYSAVQEKSLPPDRPRIFSFLLLLVLYANITVVNGFSTSFSQPYTKMTIREYDDEGIGIARFSPPAHGRLQRMVCQSQSFLIKISYRFTMGTRIDW